MVPPSVTVVHQRNCMHCVSSTGSHIACLMCSVTILSHHCEYKHWWILRYFYSCTSYFYLKHTTSFRITYISSINHFKHMNRSVWKYWLMVDGFLFRVSRCIECFCPLTQEVADERAHQPPLLTTVGRCLAKWNFCGFRIRRRLLLLMPWVWPSCLSAHVQTSAQVSLPSLDEALTSNTANIKLYSSTRRHLANI